MPYRKLDNAFFRPAGSEEYAHFNAYIGNGIIKVVPFDGHIANIQYLMMNTIASPGIMLPIPARKQANIGKCGYIEIIDGATYIMSDDFDGDPTAASFSTLQPFAYTPSPNEDFFEEAKTATLMRLPYRDRKIPIPNELWKKLNIPRNKHAIISLHSMQGAQWAELRADDDSIASNAGRFDSDILYDSISGITFRAILHGGNSIAPTFVRIGKTTSKMMYAWYSETRNAIIFEKPSEHCAVCETSIRWTDRGHYHRHLSWNNRRYMGAGNAIHTLTKVERAITNAKKLL